MNESQLSLNDNRRAQLELFQQALAADMPEFAEAVDNTWNTAYASGELSRKTKHLMAMALALGSGCRNCVLAHVEHALSQGATKQEFIETLAVVVSMRGTTGIAESLRVVQFLNEKGAW